MMNKFYSLNSGVFVLVFLAGWAAGAQVVQYAPYHGATHFVMDIVLINDDPGAIYNSAELDAAVLGGLAEQLWQLPVNPHQYDTMQEMMADWGLGVMPSGNVDNGWGATVGGVGPDAMTLPLGQVVLTHIDIGGIPGLGYDQWTSSAGSNTMALTLRIPLFQLDVDGVLGYDPSRDARLSVGAAAVPQAFVGISNDGYSHWYAPAFSYEVAWPEAGCAAADLAGDGVVGLSDVAVLASGWLSVGYGAVGDVNGDGVVDLADLAALARCWGVAIDY